MHSLGVNVDHTLKFHSDVSSIVNKLPALSNQLLRSTVNLTGINLTIFHFYVVWDTSLI